MLLTGAGRARKECEELERRKGLNRQNEMIMDKENLLQQLFIMAHETVVLQSYFFFLAINYPMITSQ